MSRKGNCLEFKLVRTSGPTGPGDRSKARNAPMESFFGSLMTELVHRARFRSRRVARAELFACIAIFCNRRRRHSSIGCRTPEQARIDMSAKMAAW
ncbi:IS3 family transposase [Mangrovicoccus sp. HB161399]|uniref:IS3 family transposase n=1 Tax=Mangrovicoccus sp. HB161399 TaxID=2720392 RepID=UPI00155830F5|nr:IS3 family transposase [Mangrovicoccus sp. HB161399]